MNQGVKQGVNVVSVLSPTTMSNEVRVSSLAPSLRSLKPRCHPKYFHQFQCLVTFLETQFLGLMYDEVKKIPHPRQCIKRIDSLGNVSRSIGAPSTILTSIPAGASYYGGDCSAIKHALAINGHGDLQACLWSFIDKCCWEQTRF